MSDTLSDWVWETRYRQQGEREILDSWKRVARALASVEQDPAGHYPRFLSLLNDFRFLPGGRILAGAGTGRDVTLFNCFVMGDIEDSLDGIFQALRESALTMQMGGGIGLDFSTLRPAGMRTRRVGVIASGPVSFMHVWDAMCATLVSSGNRRGAMMATLRCDHPDIEAFIDAKRQAGVLRNFNLSVLVTDDFVRAVEAGGSWQLIFPSDGIEGRGSGARLPVVDRAWPGHDGEVPCLVMRELPARDLWERIMRANYETAEPGVLFIDRINAENNLGDRETISATNPCGEIPLPPYGACNLGSLNLTRFVREPFGTQARFDFAALNGATETAVRLLDNVIDLSHFPLQQQTAQALGSRRIGLGVTGLADALIMLGLHYGSERARQLAAATMQTICHSAYRASIELAAEKGSFPFFDADEFLLEGARASQNLDVIERTLLFMFLVTTIQFGVGICVALSK